MKKFTHKVSVFNYTVKGIGDIKTTCRSFGNPVTSRETCTLVDMCAKCTQSDEVKQACLVKAGLVKHNKVKVKSPRGPRGVRATDADNPFTIVVIGLSKKRAKEVIIARMVEKGSTESNAKNKYSSVSCCYRALTKTASKDGAVVRYAAWIIDGKQGDQPVIDKSSKAYVDKTYATMQQYKLI